MATVEGIQKTFLSSPYFAVVGASKDQKKFGTRVLKWYQVRDLSVTPVHPVRSMLFFFSFHISSSTGPCFFRWILTPETEGGRTRNHKDSENVAGTTRTFGNIC